METETWYILDDGTNGDPREIAADAKGVLRHKDGRAVDYAPHGPRSRSVDPAEERAKAKPKAKDMKPDEPKEKPHAEADAKEADAKRATRDMKADEPKHAYKTRDAKAD